MNKNRKKSRKGFAVKVVTIALVLIVFLIAGVLAANLLGKENKKEKTEEFTVDPSKLAETKEEGFDIMEYDEYLKLDRTVIFFEKNTGASYSIDKNNYTGLGEDIKLIYELIEAIIAGDSERYNSLVHKDAGHYDDFTQQQIYDIRITREEKSNLTNSGVSYTEYVLKVEYKIHENNGSFRKDIESDSSRAQYFVIDNRTGTLLVTDIVTVKHAG